MADEYIEGTDFTEIPETPESPVETESNPYVVLVKNRINTGTYDLAEILQRIDQLWIEEKLSDTERDDMIKLARDNANYRNSYGDLEQRLEALEQWRKEVSALLPSEPVEEYPEWKQPIGSTGMYMKGDKCTYNGKKYISTVDNNVWTPEAYPQGWELVA